MDSIKIQDVRELCRKGTMRAYAKNGGVYLEDTASKESVRLDNHQVAENTATESAGKNGSRVERIFGKRESWPSAKADEGKGPYKGFLMIECESCHEIKAFCAKREIYSFKCGCGHITPLENLRPLFMHCKRGCVFQEAVEQDRNDKRHGRRNCKPIPLHQGTTRGTNESRNNDTIQPRGIRTGLEPVQSGKQACRDRSCTVDIGAVLANTRKQHRL